MAEVTAPNGIVFKRAETDEEKLVAKDFAIFFSGYPGCSEQSSLSLAPLLERLGDKVIWLCGYDDDIIVIVLGLVVHPSTFDTHVLSITLTAAPGYETLQNIRNIHTRIRSEIAWPGCCENKGAAYLPVASAESLRPTLEELFDNVEFSQPDEAGMVSMIAVMPDEPRELT